MRLLLIRHGQTPSNLQHLLDTAEPGAALTALGQEQAEALPRALVGEKVDALYASTLKRTQLTAAPLAAATGLDVRIRDGIREVSAGELEMRGDKEAVTTYLTTVFAWTSGDTGRRMPGGENGTEVLGRFDAVVQEAADTGAKTVALISHGAVIRMWVAARAENIDTAYASRHELRNTGVVILSGSPSQGWHALRWEDSPLGPSTPASGADGPAGDTLPAV
jgi:broad specificity phosphatase PhoE